MPSNEQRRETAKRKLERQLERRAQRARKRKQLTIASSALAVVLVVGAGIGIYFWHNSDDAGAAASALPEGTGPMPDAKAKPETVNCAYPASQAPAAKAAKPPRAEGIKTTGNGVEVSMSMETNQGNIGLTLDNAKSPCTVNSFVSLASQNYFDGTKCHRLTTDGIKVLQCGDPSGKGTGGPGYQFGNEFPTDQYPPNDPASKKPVAYKRGTVAMANAGPNTNGSQFFLVYDDSPLPPQYTVFGTVDDTGLKTLDKIAAAGAVAGEQGPGDGAPKLPVDVKSIRLD